MKISTLDDVLVCIIPNLFKIERARDQSIGHESCFCGPLCRFESHSSQLLESFVLFDIIELGLLLDFRIQAHISIVDRAVRKVHILQELIPSSFGILYILCQRNTYTKFVDQEMCFAPSGFQYQKIKASRDISTNRKYENLLPVLSNLFIAVLNIFSLYLASLPFSVVLGCSFQEVPIERTTSGGCPSTSGHISFRSSLAICIGLL